MRGFRVWGTEGLRLGKLGLWGLGSLGFLSHGGTDGCMDGWMEGGRGREREREGEGGSGREREGEGGRGREREGEGGRGREREGEREGDALSRVQVFSGVGCLTYSTTITTELLNSLDASCVNLVSSGSASKFSSRWRLTW